MFFLSFFFIILVYLIEYFVLDEELLIGFLLVFNFLILNNIFFSILNSVLLDKTNGSFFQLLEFTKIKFIFLNKIIKEKILLFCYFNFFKYFLKLNLILNYFFFINFGYKKNVFLFLQNIILISLNLSVKNNIILNTFGKFIYFNNKEFLKQNILLFPIFLKSNSLSFYNFYISILKFINYFLINENFFLVIFNTFKLLLNNYYLYIFFIYLILFFKN